MALGAVTMFLAREYSIGFTIRMGPGYFPTALGGILTAFGAVIALRGLLRPEQVRGAWGWRPLALVALSIVLFGALMKHAGMVPAIVASIGVAAAASRESRAREVIALACLMVIFSVAVFTYGLKLAYPLFGAS